MNKSDFIKVVANNAGITRAEADRVFDVIIDSLTECLNAGEKVQLSGFGTFELKSKDARDGINPKTGEKIAIAASKTPVFKFGKAYKDLF